MKLKDALPFYGRDVIATLGDGSRVSGRFDLYQSLAEEPDEPETIGIEEFGGFITEIPVEKVASIEAAS